MKRLILSALLFSSCISAPPEVGSKACAIENLCDVKLVSVYDGDTFFVHIPGVPAVFGRRIGVRLAGIDTPEIRASRSCERFDALQAKERLTALLSDSPFILSGVARDKYFRILADVTLPGGESVSKRLQDEGLAVPYIGETKRTWICRK